MKQQLNGFIKIHRKMLDWGWYDDTNTKVVFLHLLLTANFKDTEWHGIQLKRGDVVTSIPSLANALKLSERNVRTAISHLKATGEVTDKTYSKFRIISIKNYSQYQGDDRQTDSQPPVNRRADDSQPPVNRQQRKNDKKYKNDKKERSSSRTTTTDPTIEEVREYCSEKEYAFDVDKFFSRYAAVGWEWQGSKIKNWKVLADKWQATEYNNELKEEEPQLDMWGKPIKPKWE